MEDAPPHLPLEPQIIILKTGYENEAAGLYLIQTNSFRLEPEARCKTCTAKNEERYSIALFSFHYFILEI